MCGLAELGRAGLWRDLAGIVALGLALSGCDLENNGVAPPAAEVNFPIALAMAPAAPGEAAPFLYVANSNFDLRYNAGSVQAYDLAALEAALSEDDRGEVVPPTSVLVDGAGVNPEVRIGAHAASMALSPDGDRLYLAVRSDANLTYVDLNPATGSLDCGGGAAVGHACTDTHRRGDDSVSSPRNIDLPGDPTGIVAGSLRDFGVDSSADWIMTSHRAGRASLFLEEGTGAPLLVHSLSGLPTELVNLRFDAGGEQAWLLSADEARVGRVGVAWDRGRLQTSFLYDAGALALVGVDDGQDARDVRFGTLPNGHAAAYVLARRPEALLVMDLDLSTPSALHVVRAIEVGFGPSRLAVGRFGPADAPRELVFASCYDSRDVWVVDPVLGEALSVVRGMSGPFELAVDESRARLYVSDFRASVVRVADLSPLLDCLGLTGTMVAGSCEPQVLGTIGKPRPVGDLL